MRVLFDTNILIDYFKGVSAAEEQVDGALESAISIIAWIEIMAGVTPSVEGGIRKFLAGIPVLWLTPAIAEQAASLRREFKLKLPDAVILATAQVESYLLVTRNTRDFGESSLGVRIPYRL